MKASFMLYTDQYPPICSLSLEQKGLLLDAIFAHHAGREVCLAEPVVAMAFAFFRQAFERDAKNYERKCQKNKENVLKRYPRSTDAYEGMRAHTKATDTDTDTGTDTDTDTLNTEERGANAPTLAVFSSLPRVKKAAPPKATPPKAAMPPKANYGEYQRVRLTADEHARLRAKVGSEVLAAAITKLDLHIEAKGKDEYKCHAAALQKWVFAAVAEDRQRGRGSPAWAAPEAVDPAQEAKKAEAVQKTMQRVEAEAQRKAAEFLERGRAVNVQRGL